MAQSGREELDLLRSRTLWQTVLASAARFPDRQAFIGAVDGGPVNRLTYTDLIARVRALSAGMASMGVRRGDRVALWMTNSIEWIVSMLSAARIGAAAVPINTFLKPVEIGYFIAQSGARHLIMFDRFRKLRMPDMLREICPEFTDAATPGHLNSLSHPDLRNVVVCHRGGGAHPGAFDFAQVEARGRDDPAARDLADWMERQVRPSDLALIKFTSGSTNLPKGAMLEQGGMVANGKLHSRRTGIGEDDIFFSQMPFFHAGGSIWGIMTTLVNGGTLVFTEAFNAARAADLIASEKATVLWGALQQEVVQSALERGITLPSLRIAATPDDDARKVMPNVTYCMSPYGLTEAYGVASVTSPHDPPEKQMRTGGRMLEGNECRAVDPDTGEDVPLNTPGEAWIRGNVMRGYWNKPEETKRVLTDDGWLKCEDLISIDEQGFITYVGRIKLMLKVGAENVSLEEVESVAAGHDAVLDCAAVGVPDPRKDEAVRIYVTLVPGRALSAPQLLDWLKPRLASFKMPREILFIDELPRLANGKPDRIALNRWAQIPVEA